MKIYNVTGYSLNEKLTLSRLEVRQVKCLTLSDY
jgi:hypothetical protein